MNVLTVREALEEPFFAGSELVGGTGGLGRPVDTVGVVDVSDLDAVRPRQFLLSSAYPLRGRDLEELVRQVVPRGASALGIKLSRFWPAMPSPLVEAAEEMNLPLLVLPEGPFDEIVNPLLALIADRQTESLRRSADVHNALTEAALREEGNPAAVAEILTRALGGPAAVLGERGELLAWTGPRELWSEGELVRHVHGATEPSSIEVAGETYFLAPVPAGGGSSGAVCVRGVDPGSSFVRASVAHGAVVAGMLLAGRRQVEAIYVRFQRELIEDLVDRRLVDPDEARERAARIGWPLDRPYVVMMASHPAPGPLDPSAPPSLRVEERSLPALTRAVAEEGREVRLFLRRPGLGIVLHLAEDDEPRRIASAISERLRSDDMPSLLRHVVIGVSDPRIEVVDLADATREASLSILLAPPGREEARPVVHVRDLGPVQLLARVRDRARLTSSARWILGPLADFDLPRHRDLFLTLSALLARNMSVSATAKDMFFHYNTVRHRLGRLRDTMEGRQGSPAGRLSLSLAVVAIRLEEADQALAGSPARPAPVRPDRSGRTSP